MKFKLFNQKAIHEIGYKSELEQDEDFEEPGFVSAQATYRSLEVANQG